MNKTLEKIILDWIGENRDSRYSDADGVNSALSDLRARVPELVETINNLQSEEVQFISYNRSKSNYEAIRDSIIP